MSAIWGIIKKNECDSHVLVTKMSEVMGRYKIDRIDEVVTDKACFACGHQYITPEAINDISPIKDDDGIVFTADCFLYNREAVIEAISASNEKVFKASEELETAGDAEIAYYAFKALGYDFVKMLRGSFSFAIFDSKENKLHLFTEHLCKRYLCYYITDDYICFSSVYKPIMEIAGDNLTISRRSIAKSYTTLSPLNFYEPETTVFEEIKHLDAAMHYTIDLTSGSVDKDQYWTPRKSVKKLKGKSLDECKQMFLDTFKKVTYAELRAQKETGIMLSGGLDSSAVMSLAAPYLREKGKTIYSYTTIPSPQYKAEISSVIIENETFLVKEQQKLHSNHQPRFISSESYNCISTLDRFQEMFDIPVKASVNNANITHMLDAAITDNCSIVLSGSNGNPTISYGSIGGYISLSLRQGHLINACKEANAYCKREQISRADFLKSFIKSRITYHKFKSNNDISYLKPEDFEEYDIKNFRENEKKTYGEKLYLTEKQKRNYMFIPKQYIQKAYYYTVLGLEYGFLQIDPTLTVEIVELCMALPDECFVHDGIERYLVRGFMKDLIPEPITNPNKGYGVQASDFDFRINEDWKEIKEETMNVLREPLLKEYLNEDPIQQLIDDIVEHDDHLDRVTVWSMTSIAALSYFLRGHKKYIK